jgi:hypothetical protein
MLKLVHDDEKNQDIEAAPVDLDELYPLGRCWPPPC